MAITSTTKLVVVVVAIFALGLLARFALPAQRTKAATGRWVFGSCAGAVISWWGFHDLGLTAGCLMVALLQAAFGPMEEG